MGANPSVTVKYGECRLLKIGKMSGGSLIYQIMRTTNAADSAQ
jgi:hypothetical protein